MEKDPDLMLRRFNRKQKVRQKWEEERQRERLAYATPPTVTAIETEAAAIKKVPQNQQQQQYASCTNPEIPERTRSFDVPTPQETFFPLRSSNQSSYPKDVGFLHMKSSPSSSVSMSQSPLKKVADRPTLPVRKKRLLDSDSEDEDMDIQECARQREISEAERKQAAAAQGTVRVVARAPQTAVDDDDSDSDSDSDASLLAAAWEIEVRTKGLELAMELRAKRELAKSSANQNVEVTVVETPRSIPALALVCEQKAADVDNRLLPPVKRLSEEAEEQLLWSDSEDEAQSTPQSSSQKAKKKEGGDDIEARLAAFVGKNRKKRRQVPMNDLKRDRGGGRAVVPAIANISAAADEDELRKQWKPEFDRPKFGPYDPPTPLFLVGGGESGDEEFQVPASICRYLPEYQREGIEFIFRSAIVPKKGAILGDDMGLGKTIQTIALLAALFRKTGTGLDLLELNRRKKLVEARTARIQSEKEKALLEGRIYVEKTDDNEVVQELGLPAWSPVLIVAPKGVVTNWVEDFKTWAHCSVAVYQGAGREAALESVENGLAEVLVCGHSMIQGTKDFGKLYKFKWKIVIVDEFHFFKNESKQLATNLRKLQKEHHCIVVGLTGTVMQNNHTELWNLVDIVAENHLGTWSQFDDEYGKPIKFSRATDATPDAVELGALKARELSTKLNEVYLRRTKEEKLGDVLPAKDERIIFCDPSKLQKKLYNHILSQPDFILLRHQNAPCDCGTNQKFFFEYQHLRTQEEQTEYQRKNRKKIIPRGKCCYPIPKCDGGIDLKAILWRQHHPRDEPCDHCPSCILLAAISILYKLSSHAALLQVKSRPEDFGADSKQREEAEKKVERARHFLPEHLLSQLPGGYFRESGMMDDHFGLSGKMAVLHTLLEKIGEQQGRVLLFAHSTQALDLIENYISSVGYSYLRMDGKTSTKKRKEIADQFRASSEIFVFLLSTKAMGVGLNLTQASFVIIFDVDWNPATDSQAQDRAYRIGQEQNVKVFRLVSRGTIEELKYLRQVYKTQLQCETIVNVDDSDRFKALRLFRGVQGDLSRKGELFGQENLLKFKDGTFMNYASKMSESRQYGNLAMHDTNDLLDTVKDLTVEDIDYIGEDGNIFEDLARCMEGAVGSNDDMDRDSDSEDDSQLGGESQAVMDICERNKVHEEEGGGLAEIREEKEAEFVPLAEPNDSSQHERKAADGIPPMIGDTARSCGPSAGDYDAAVANDSPQERKAATGIRPTAVPDTVPSSRPLADGFAADETQSPMNVAVSSNPQVKREKQSDEIIPNSRQDGLVVLPDKKPTINDHDVSGTVVDGCQPAFAYRKATPRNTQLVGKTTDNIRLGEAGQTTFTASDLFLPGGSRKMKRKKRS